MHARLDVSPTEELLVEVLLKDDHLVDRRRVVQVGNTTPVELDELLEGSEDAFVDAGKVGIGLRGEGRGSETVAGGRADVLPGRSGIGGGRSGKRGAERERTYLGSHAMSPSDA